MFIDQYGYTNYKLTITIFNTSTRFKLNQISHLNLGLNCVITLSRRPNKCYLLFAKSVVGCEAITTLLKLAK